MFLIKFYSSVLKKPNSFENKGKKEYQFFLIFCRYLKNIFEFI